MAKSIKFVELDKMRNSSFLEEKKTQNILFCAFFCIWTSDKNLETQKHNLDPKADIIKQILKFP